MTTTPYDDIATVEVVVPGKLVRVGPARVNVNDVLELAEALIGEHGWRKTHGVEGDPGGPERPPYTIHRAVGEAAKRAVDAHGKDADDARALRDEANDRIMATHGGRTDIQLNDEPRCNARRAMRVLAHARGEGRSNGDEAL